MTTNDLYTGWSSVPSRETRQMIRDASRQMGSLVQSTLGPQGMDKMIVRRMPDDELRYFVSNDGSAIIEEFDGETDHPIAKHFIRAVEDHEDDYGDGATTMTLLASELLATAMDLTDRGIHPNDVIEGFSIGAQRTLETWTETSIPLADASGELDREKLRAVVMTGMTNGREKEWPLGAIADTVVDAVVRVSDPETGSVRLDHAKTVTVPGGEVTDTELVEGVVLPETVVTAERLLPATGPVLLVDGALQSRSLSADVNINVESEGDIERTAGGLDESEAIAANVALTGAVAVVATGDVDMAVAKELARHGAILLRNVKTTDFRYIARATGASPRGPIRPNTLIDEAVLGEATVRFRDTGRDDDWVAFEPPAGVDVPAVTLVVRGGTQTAAEEAERRIRDGKNALRACVLNPTALPAGGAAELAAAGEVRALSTHFDGREQLAVEAFADVLESIPKTLARNSGLDPLGALADLRTRHDAGHGRAAVSADGTIVDDVTADGGGLDPFQIRVSGLIRAVEFVNVLTRIDGVLLDEREPTVDRVLGEPKYGPGEMPEN
ncbi:TCP-1/cpn60 chaperonin family protein [Halegenticoccus soli]|uniref:TCP-1/cpn60 chaperonin family protein n=1 Tax=Halegenticoccus soli TaxID=1985678 RepID=UPI000C6D8F13|nr:TCP-1/cpn60 chaperonin family protein [Halegenticoccus soli]